MTAATPAELGQLVADYGRGYRAAGDRLLGDHLIAKGKQITGRVLGGDERMATFTPHTGPDGSIRLPEATVGFLADPGNRTWSFERWFTALAGVADGSAPAPRYGNFHDVGDGPLCLIRNGHAQARATRLCRELWEDYSTGQLKGAELRHAASYVWFKAARPLWFLSPDRWRKVFRDSGYTIDGQAAPPPIDPVRLYRAAAAQWIGQPRTGTTSPVYGWSWTASLRTAGLFLARQQKHEDPQVATTTRIYTLLAPPQALLAHLTMEREIVVDADLLPPSAIRPI